MALCPVLVQRDDQLAVLESALMSAHGGEGGLAVLSGEPGSERPVWKGFDESQAAYRISAPSAAQ
jgi:hypothetical protein